MIGDEEKLPFTDHLDELRSRLIKCFIAVGIGFAASFAFKEKIFWILTRPLMKVMEAGDKLIFTVLTEAFFTYLKAAFICGILVASPYLLYQFWMFIAPGLYRSERRMMIPVLLCSTLFFVGGALFGYFLVFPWGFKFLLGFRSDTIEPMLAMKDYLGLSTRLLLAFGVTFELPIVLTFLARLGIVSVPFLKKNRKYAVLLFFVGSALITPPDVVSQVMMAFPLMALYELSIVGAYFFGRPKRTAESNSEEAPESTTDTHGD